MGLISLAKTAHLNSQSVVPPVPKTAAVTFDTPVPLTSSLPLPRLTAKAFLVKDINTHQILAEHHAYLTLAPASTTKLMTALVSLDAYPPHQMVQLASMSAEGSKVGFQPRERVTIEQLLYGLLLPSGNDAAIALANAYPGGPAEFIRQMNYHASRLHLNNTYYQNPSGLDDPGQLSSAADLAILGEQALRHPLLSHIVSTKEYEIVPQDASPSATYKVKNLNKLLFSEPGVTGVKTGYTQEAGEVLVTGFQQESYYIVIVVMGSQDRFGETKQLIDWFKSSFIPSSVVTS